MKNLGNIKILIMCDSYIINFKYATPKYIDFFALTLFEIIRHSQNFKGETIKNILEMLEIPKDLHYVFKDRLKDLMKNPVMVNYDEDKILSIFSHNNEIHIDELLNNVESYSLTPMGEEGYTSKKITEKPQSWSKEYIYKVYETSSNSLAKRDMVIIPDTQHAIIVEMDTHDENEVKNTFTRIITESPKKFIADANDKTKIFDLVPVPTGKVGIRDNILVSIDGRKLIFDNKNKKILKAFLSVSEEEKSSTRNKMFNYLDIPQTKLNFDKAEIAVKRLQPIKMKVAFGKKAAIEAVTDTVNMFDIDQLAYSGDCDFCFAGITDKDRPLIYNYCEVTEQGYTLPLEELNYSDKNYNTVFSSVFEGCKDTIEKGLNYEYLISFAILASPPELKTSVVMSIMGQTKELKSALAKAKTIFFNTSYLLNGAGGSKAINDTVNGFIIDLIKENLSKDSIDADTVISIMNEFNLPKESTIKILAEGSPKTDKTINALLAIDEPTTVRIYELVKLYNSLLNSGKLSDIKHNSNIYSAFLAYERQYEKLKTFGFKNYYEYDRPKNWDEFIKEVRILNGKFDGIKDKLENDTAKQAIDFFTRVKEDYAITKIDEKAVKKLLDGGDLYSVIKAEKIDAPLIAFAIRSKYEEVLRAREKTKGPKATEERKGRTLISYVIEPKSVDEVYKNWRDLCALVHKETEENNPLWKGSDADRRKVLNRALTCYHQKLASKEKKK